MKPMRLIGGLVVVVLSQGCSMAIMGTDFEPTDRSSIRIGATRAAVENVLGAADKSEATGAGKIAIYTYDKGAPAGSLYTARDYMECMALLNIFCEVLMTPMALSERHDLYQSQRGLIKIIYGPDETIVEFSYQDVVREEPAEMPGPDAECGTAETQRHCPY